MTTPTQEAMYIVGRLRSHDVLARIVTEGARIRVLAGRYGVVEEPVADVTEAGPDVVVRFQRVGVVRGRKLLGDETAELVAQCDRIAAALKEES